MSLRIRRGTNSQRSGVAFDLGEIVWTTDTERLYVGDGITSGGKNILAQSAGSGLVWNPTTQQIDISGNNLTTSAISEGTNLYFTPERAQGAAASLFTSGTHSNISFFYDDAANKINATVTLDGVGLANVQADPAPTLGGNLTMNGKNITGTGGISITGNISGTTISGNLGANLGLNSYNISGTGNISITGSITGTTLNGNLGSNMALNSFSIVGNGAINIFGGITGSSVTGTTVNTATTTINGNNITTTAPKPVGPYRTSRAIFFGDGTSANATTLWVYSDDNFGVFTGATADGLNNPGVTTRISRGTVSSKTAMQSGDFIGFNEGQAWTGTDWVTSGAFGMLVDPTPGTVVTATSAPGAFGVLTVSSTGSQNQMVFNSSGVLSVPVVKVSDVAGTLPSPATAGMIVLDGSTFKGYNGSAWVTLG